MTSTSDRCDRFREAISARLDGEDTGVGAELLDAHIAGCESCRRYATDARAQWSRLRIRAADPVPDLSQRILLAIPEGTAPRLGRRLPTRRAVFLVAASLAVAISVGYGVGLLVRSPGHAASTVKLGQTGQVYEANARFPGALVYPPGAPAIRKPSVALKDIQGHPYDIASRTQGRVTLLYFGYTRCPDVCPINMELTGQALRDLPPSIRSKVTVVFITTDPDRDTGPVISRWLGKFDQSLSPFIGLRGSIGQIHQAERQVGMPLSYAEAASPKDGGYTIVHAGYVLLFSRNGIAHMQVDNTETPAQYARTIEDLVR